MERRRQIMQGLVCLCMGSGFCVKWEAWKVLRRDRIQSDMSFTRNSGKAVKNGLGGAAVEAESQVGGYCGKPGERGWSLDYSGQGGGGKNGLGTRDALETDGRNRICCWMK